jgi:hypothetical protein
MVITNIRNSRYTKLVALITGISLLFQLIPFNGYALTGGPSQPEVQSFEPIGTSDMVDLFSGDFKYNIPLLDVGGYPLNISYHSGIGMDQEASWVGLGWSINPGVINREMRGIPDDFNGKDKIVKKEYRKPNTTIGLSMSGDLEIFGKGIKLKKFSTEAKGAFTLGIRHNNYLGFDAEAGLSPSLSLIKPNKGSLNMELGISSNGDGVNFNPNISYSAHSGSSKRDDNSFTPSIGGSYNTSAGLQALSFGIDAPRMRNGRASFNFSPTFVPEVDMPMYNQSFTLSVKGGTSIFGADASADYSGYITSQALATNIIHAPAYGYMYSADANPDQNMIMDFNREKDIAYTPNQPGLPITNHTYDVFSISAQGASGTFRAHLGAIGTVYKGSSYNISTGGSAGFELGALNVSKGGVDLDINYVNTTSGKWDNQVTRNANFAKSTDAGDDFEPVYFKDKNEMASNISSDVYSNIGGNNPVRVSLNGGMPVAGDVYRSLDNFTPGDNQTVTRTNLQANDLDNNNRVARNQLMTVLTAEEANLYGLEKKIRSYNQDPVVRLRPTSNSSLLEEIDRVSDIASTNYWRKPHHISEITLTQTNGSRYVFGIPVYNISQEDITFNVDINDALNGVQVSNNQVSYSYPEYEIPPFNNRGRDNYYTSSKMPSYAHSYLLTAVLSQDYSDNDGIDGPTPNDVGTYTKLNYKRLYETYEWRTPYKLNTANFNEQLKSKNDDDKANLTVGKKEIWQLRSIETKTHVAVFETSPREDALSSSDQQLEKLDKIILYNLDDLYKEQNDPSGSYKAFPIKTVHFTYDYSLCPNVDNNKGSLPNGKLTLKSIHFTYGTSNKSHLSPYKFFYPDHNNYDYGYQQYDRWGNYKNPGDNPTLLGNGDFPYTLQDKSKTDVAVSAWTLNKIKLPSGGEINITYESDDYAYVQDKRAMEMITVAGFNNKPTYNGSQNRLLSWNGNTDNNNYLIFPLSNGHSPSDYLLDENGEVLKYLYFSMLVNMNSPYENTANEFIKGYCEISEYGVCPDNGNYGYILLDEIPITDREKLTLKINPIAKASMEFYSSNLKREKDELIDKSSPADLVSEVVTLLPQVIGGIVELFINEFRTYIIADRCTNVELNKSYIRLYSPSNFKLGGGVRVAKVAISDNWDEMTSDSKYSESIYGQEYTYTTIDDRTGKTISSGVASYEPMIGNDENPCRQPENYSIKVPLGRNPKLSMELPYGESFYPGASVGYSKIKVNDLKNKYLSNDNITRHATGHSIHEFYTAKDFPVRVYSTEVDKVPFNTNPIVKLFRLVVKEYLTTSQGYAIELNDMHGKQKAQWIYSEGQDFASSGVEYKYHTTGGSTNNITNNQNILGELVNEVDVIDTDKSISKEMIGVNVDFVLDSREAQTTAISAGLSPNVNTFMAAAFPGVVPTVWPSFSMEKTRYRSIVATKVIHRHGLIKEVIAHDLGSSVSTENLAYDKHTGEVLVTKTKNEYDDAKYSFTYPAHWEYDKMGHAYKNINLTASGVTIDNDGNAPDGRLVFQSNNDISRFMTVGDEISINDKKYWVISKTLTSSSPEKYDVFIVQHTGVLASALTTASELKIIRSGRRNLQSSPIGSIVSTKSPISNNSISISSSIGILDAESIEYSENWQMKEGSTDVNSSFVQGCQLTIDGIGYMDFWNLVLESGFKFSVYQDNITNPIISNPVIYNGSTGTLQEIDLGFNKLNIIKQGSTSPITVSGKCFIELCSPSNNSTQLSFALYDENLNPILGNSYNDNINIQFQDAVSGGSIIGLGSLDESKFGTFFDPRPDASQQYTMSPSNPYIWFANLSYEYEVYGVMQTHNLWLPDNNPVVYLCRYSESGNSNLTACGKQVNNIVNPYYESIRGVWKPIKSYKFLTSREQTYFNSSGTSLNMNDNTNLRSDGVYSSFVPFNWNNVPQEWQNSAEVTLIDAAGNEIENKDPLDRYSSAVYGYRNKLPIAVAQNAMNQEIGFDGFEDYLVEGNCLARHFNFDGNENMITEKESHTGRFSISVSHQNPVSMTRTLNPHPSTYSLNETTPFRLSGTDLYKGFSPLSDYDSDQGFLISYWVKESHTSPDVNSFDSDITISLDGTNLTLTPISNFSPIIEGWQQKTFRFNIPRLASEKDIVITLNNNQGVTSLSYFDDIRVLPIDAQMKSYVYDYITHRLMAELDANNYATFYEYNEEGALVRVKKETERGVMMIQSIQQHSSQNTGLSN